MAAALEKSAEPAVARTSKDSRLSFDTNQDVSCVRKRENKPYSWDKPALRLLDEVRRVLRLKHYSMRTEVVYVGHNGVRLNDRPSLLLATRAASSPSPLSDTAPP